MNSKNAEPDVIIPVSASLYPGCPVLRVWRMPRMEKTTAGAPTNSVLRRNGRRWLFGLLTPTMLKRLLIPAYLLDWTIAAMKTIRQMRAYRIEAKKPMSVKRLFLRKNAAIFCEDVRAGYPG